MESSAKSSNPMSASSLGSSPLYRIASFFEKARKSVGLITLAPGTLDTIKKYRGEWSQHSGREVDALVRALEDDGTGLCRRLDTTAFIIICSVLVHTESCLSQQRGFYLLAQTLRESDSTTLQATKAKKTATGRQALIPLIKGFTKNDEPDQTRRWMGVLALELLKGCEQNVALLQDDTSTLQTLNNVIEHGRCQVLKLLAGSIIHAVLSAGVAPEQMWPSKKEMELWSQFPRAQHYDTQWVTAFEGFVDYLGSRNALSQERSSVIFAFVLSIGATRYVTVEESAILVTVSQDLNIIIPSSSTGSTTYIDVPLDHINSMIIDSQANSQSQTPNHALVMCLSGADGITCYLNASANKSNSIALAFAEENDAKALMRLMQPKTVDKEKAKGCSMSASLENSQVDSDDISEDELAVSSHANNEELRTLATQAESFLASDPKAHTYQSQRPASGIRPGQQSFVAAKNDERSASIAMGLDVSEPAFLSNAKNGSRGARKPFEHEVADQETPRDFDQTSDTDMPSPRRRKKVGETITNAPVFSISNGGNPEQQATKVPSPHNQDEDYDSTYDVSPRGLKVLPDPSRSEPSPPQSSHKPNGVLDEYLSTGLGANLGNRGTVSMSPKAAAASQPHQPQESIHAAVVSGSPDAGVGSTNKASHSKISRRLRNMEGNVEDAISPMETAESRSLTKRGAPKKRIEQPPPKRSTRVIERTQAGVQKRAKPLKKPALERGKEKAREDQLSNNGDEYDLEPSPDSAAPTGRKQAQPSRRRKKDPGKSATLSGANPPKMGSNALAKATAVASRLRKDEGPEDESVWQTSHSNRKTPLEKTQQPGPKQADAQTSPASKETQTSQLPAKPKSKPRSKAAPVAPSQPRSKRAAAIKANKRIQGLEDIDEIVDVDGPTYGDAETKSPSIPKKNGNTSTVITNISESLRFDEGTAQAISIPQPRTQGHEAAEVANDNRNINEFHQKAEKPATQFRTKNSSPERDENVKEPLMLPRLNSHKDTKMIEPNDHNTDAVAPSLQSAAPHKELQLEILKQSLSNNISDRAHENLTEQQQRKQPPVTRVVDGFTHGIHDSEESITSDMVPETISLQEEIVMMGDFEDSHFQEAMAEFDDVSLQPDRPQTSVDADVDVSTSKKPPLARVTSPLVKGNNEDTRVQKEMLSVVGRSPQRGQGQSSHDLVPETISHNTPTSIREPLHPERHRVAIHAQNDFCQTDPFGAKLRPLVPVPEDLTRPHRVAQSSKIKQVAKDQNKLPPKAPSVVQDNSIKEARKAKAMRNTTQHLPTITNKQQAPPQQDPNLVNKETKKPAFDGRRNVDEGSRVKEKSVKLKAGATNNAHAIVNDRKNFIEVGTPFPIARSKPGLISWSTSGPRNQGTISAHQRGISPGDTHAIRFKGMTSKTKDDERRTTAPFLDDPASWEHDRLGQPQETYHRTPRRNPKLVPPMVPEVNVSAIHVKAHRLSSQSTKVDENGSPMPSADQFHHRVRYKAKPDVLPFAIQDEEMIADENIQDPYRPDLPILPKREMPETEDLAFATLTSNRKQLPSSPHAPSTHASIPPHVVLRNGEMVNEKTLESVVPTLPQDPFVGGNPRPPSSFMKILHKAALAEVTRKSEQHKKDTSADQIKRKPLVDDDPDKTLVEREHKRHKKNHSNVIESPSTSDTTSREESTEKDSDPESDSTTARWQQTLDPHQANVLDIFSNITNRLVRHLVDKETAVADIVDDYEKRGNTMLQEYNTSRRQVLETDKAGLELSKRKFANVYTQAEANLRRISKDVYKRSTRAMDARVAEWYQQQQNLDNTIERAIATCVEG